MVRGAAVLGAGRARRVDRAISESLYGSGEKCRATINMRTRVNLDENPVWGEAGRA